MQNNTEKEALLQMISDLRSEISVLRQENQELQLQIQRYNPYSSQSYTYPNPPGNNEWKSLTYDEIMRAQFGVTSPKQKKPRKPKAKANKNLKSFLERKII